jgi:hypothetical protein
MTAPIAELERLAKIELDKVSHRTKWYYVLSNGNKLISTMD